MMRGTKMKNSLKKIYHYLFDYDNNKPDGTNQYSSEILTLLTMAMHNQKYVLVTFQDGQSEIGQVNQQLSAQKFILRSTNQKLLHIVDINYLIRVDLA